MSEFHDRYWQDRSQGLEHDSLHYQRQFPRDAELIATEFEGLIEKSTTGRPLPDSTSPTAMALERIGPYHPIELLGRGGQAQVWLALDSRVHRKVALKVLDLDQGAAPEVIERFRREAALTARIDHPGICPMLDVGGDERPFIAMRYVPGETLSRHLRLARSRSEGRGPIDLSETATTSTRSSTSSRGSTATGTGRELRVAIVLRFVEKIARALHAAHEVGVVHRDLKPANVMVQPDGDPVILDFGIALDETIDAAALTRAGDIVGTPAYIAPEQIETHGHPVDRRADIHALGVILFECLTLRRPFEGTSREAVFRSILADEAPRLRSMDPSLSEDLSVVVETALQKKPEHRYLDAESLADDLCRVIENRPIAARPLGPLLRLLRWGQRNRPVAISLMALFFVLVTGLCSALLLLDQTRDALRGESHALVRERAARDEAVRQRQSLFRLRSRERLDELRRVADEELWPVNPISAGQTRAMLARVERWIVEVEDLVGGIARADPHTGAPSHMKQLDELRRRARIPAGVPAEGGGRDFEFDSADDAWWFEKLSSFVEDLRRIDGPDGRLNGDSSVLGWSVMRRRDFLRTLEERSLDQPRRLWDEVAGRVRENPVYDGFELTPQLGLVPIGTDPESGLEEFAFLASGEVPVREPESGSIEMAEETAIVFVLIPPGACLLASQNESPESPNFDPFRLSPEGPPFEFRTPMFFLSKYEMTQGQWQRLCCEDTRAHGENSSARDVQASQDGRHPVCSVNVFECRQRFERFGLVLPTEPAWEYAYRAGSSTIWHCGDDRESLKGVANLADLSAIKAGMEWPALRSWPGKEIDDGHVRHAPVGQFRANAFGLHDMAGNVAEWTDRPGQDPKTAHELARTARGGSFISDFREARASSRFMIDGRSSFPFVGVRPAKAVCVPQPRDD